MSNSNIFIWGGFAMIIVMLFIACLFGSVKIDGLSLTDGWHRWAIVTACALWLVVILHGVFYD